MKFLILFLTMFLTAGAPKIPKPEVTDQNFEVAGLTFEKQLEKEWCAAASTRILLSAKTKKLPSQCEIISKVRGEDCCKKRTIKCLQPIRIEEAAPHFGAKAELQTPVFSAVIAHVKAGRAVAIYHKNWAGTPSESGHAVVAFGTYTKPDGKSYIVVYDPYTNTKKYWNNTYVTGNLAWYSMVVLKTGEK